MKLEIFFGKETYSVKLSNGEVYSFPIKGRSKDEIMKKWKCLKLHYKEAELCV